MRRFFIVQIGQGGHELGAGVPQRHLVGAKLNAPRQLRIAARAFITQQRQHGLADLLQPRAHNALFVRTAVDEALIERGKHLGAGDPSHGRSNLEWTIDSFRYDK